MLSVILLRLWNLKKQFSDVAKTVNAENMEMEDLKKHVRQHDDELDNSKQRKLVGKIVITSQDKGSTSPIKTKQISEQEVISLEAHVVELLKTKYDLVIEKRDIENQKRCHCGIFHKQEVSRVSIPEVGRKDQVRNLNIPLYFNFMLTRKRSKLLLKI